MQTLFFFNNGTFISPENKEIYTTMFLAALFVIKRKKLLNNLNIHTGNGHMNYDIFIGWNTMGQSTWVNYINGINTERPPKTILRTKITFE